MSRIEAREPWPERRPTGPDVVIDFHPDDDAFPPALPPWADPDRDLMRGERFAFAAEHRIEPLSAPEPERCDALYIGRVRCELRRGHSPATLHKAPDPGRLANIEWASEPTVVTGDGPAKALDPGDTLTRTDPDTVATLESPRNIEAATAVVSALTRVDGAVTHARVMWVTEDGQTGDWNWRRA